MKKLGGEDKAGLYITVIFHLTVIIVLLASQLGYSIQRENSFVLDFSKQEAKEQLKKEVELKEAVSKKLDQMIATQGHVPIRNVAVNKGALKDDRGTNAEELYKDAERLQKELEKTFKGSVPEVDEDYASLNSPKKEEKSKEEAKPYSGPSVVSYQLDGRKASHLPIPAYRCMGAGEVTVIITVDNSGKVIMAKVQEGVSSDDQCLRNFAVRAARAARFSASPTAPARQMGNIVYAFIAQ